MRDALRELQRQADNEPEDRARVHAAARALAHAGDSRGAFERLFGAGLIDDAACAPLLAELGAALAAEEAGPRALLSPAAEVETCPRSPSLAPDAALGPVTGLRFPRAASDPELAAIAGLPSLRSLIIERPCRITEAQLDAIAGRRKLTLLRLGGASLPRRSDALGALRQLAALSLNATAINDEALEKVIRAAPLRLLSLGYAERSLAQRRLVSEARELRSLSLVDCGLEAEDITVMGALTRLESLELSFNLLGDQGWESLAGLTKLTRLSLVHTGIADAALPALAQIEALEDLDLRGTRVTSDGVQVLGDLQRLKVLGLPRAVDPTAFAVFEHRGVQVRPGS